MKLAIGFITYNQSTFKYLSFFLSSLLNSINQAKKNFPNLELNILVVDNSNNNYKDNYNFLINFLKDDCANKIWNLNENLGFSKAYNLMINFSIKNNDDIFLMLNPDVLVDVYFIEELLKSYQKNPEISVFAPKILYWNFSENKKTDIIDSYGIGISKSHYFFDIGQGENSNNFLSSKKEIFGFTGAGALLNLKQLIKVAYNNKGYLEFFDELMFMYKEDVDLSYRLQLKGLKIIFIPSALMYHDRTLSKNKFIKYFFSFNKNVSRSHSFLNQLMILYKINKILPFFSFKIRIFTKFRLLFLYIYGLFFEKKQIKKIKKTKPKISEKGLYSLENIENIRKIEEFICGY